jgi:hypothetical protein
MLPQVILVVALRVVPRAPAGSIVVVIGRFYFPDASTCAFTRSAVSRCFGV